MKRTTIYLEPELELLLKLEMRRRGKPMAELIRDALRSYLRLEGGEPPPGAGAFTSGRRGTAANAEGELRRLRFGRER
jgi:hypothetical protein